MSDRREFLGQLAAVAAAPSLITRSPGRRVAQPLAWDLSWLDSLAAKKHKAVFDATMITSGLAPGHVDLYLRNYNEIYGVDEKDMGAVLVIRHEAVPMVLNDAFWQKYQLGSKLRLNDPATGSATTRNYFAAGGTKPVPELTTLENLHGRGVIILGCNKALMSVAQIMAQQAGQPVEAVQAEARAAVMPFVTLMPSGVFAVMRAQEAGCQYMRST
jgi:intracellular sulfur oxidation DsrE/DsrF family protein